MSSITASEVLHFASTLAGERVPTIAGRAAFHIRRIPGGLEVTPESTRKPRIISQDTVQRVLDVYCASGSLSPSRYQGITFDASYLLAVITRITRQNG